MESRAGEIDKTKPVLLYCLAGKRSQEAFDLLKGLGFRSLHQLKGGIEAWEEKNLPVMSKDRNGL